MSMFFLNSYECKDIKTKAYGSYNKETGSWNGMVRRIMDGEADVGIAVLDINYNKTILRDTK